MEGLFGDLKTFLSLAMPNQYCQKLNIKLVLGDTLGQEIPNLHEPYSTTVLYDYFLITQFFLKSYVQSLFYLFKLLSPLN